MTDSPYKALSADDQTQIQTSRLRELEEQHYRIALDLDDAVSIGDEQAQEHFTALLSIAGRRVGRAQHRLGLFAGEVEA